MWKHSRQGMAIRRKQKATSRNSEKEEKNSKRKKQEAHMKNNRKKTRKRNTKKKLETSKIQNRGLWLVKNRIREGHLFLKKALFISNRKVVFIGR